MKRVLIAGVGNILLGDDGVGPFVIRRLAANYVFEEGVELEDLGTPTLDFVDHIVGLDALIVVDAVNNGQPAGTVTVYEKADLLKHAPSVRLDPHSPALIESLLTAEFHGGGPESAMLVGVTGESYAAECRLTRKVEAAVEETTRTILRLLDTLNIGFIRRFEEPEAAIWWSERRAEYA